MTEMSVSDHSRPRVGLGWMPQVRFIMVESPELQVIVNPVAGPSQVERPKDSGDRMGDEIVAEHAERMFHGRVSRVSGLGEQVCGYEAMDAMKVSKS